jgi:S-(hydroxymethyl)glutathione dehydrogenase/alcohol dehydrogenase
VKTNAAVLHESGQPWEVVELEVDKPGHNEVFVEWSFSGLCHSDEHMRHGDVRPRYPIIGGHEGAGYVREVGPGVTRVEVGQPVVSSFIPACGHCRWCSTGHSNLCDLGASIQEGSLPGGRFVFHRNGLNYGALGTVATFAQFATVSEYSVVPISEDIPLQAAALVACGVPTGWGSAVYAADTEPGDTITVIGIGGVGINAIQGAAYAGAKNIVAVDLLENKREFAKPLGATHSAASAVDALDLVMELTGGVGSDKTIITVGLIEGDLVNEALRTVRKGGTLVITTWADPEKNNLSMSSVELTGMERRIQGSLYGSGNPNRDIVKLLDLYHGGQLKLDELITNTYKLKDITQGYEDMLNGVNIRGAIRHG